MHVVLGTDVPQRCHCQRPAAQIFDPIGWTAEFLEWGALWLIAADDKVRAGAATTHTSVCIGRCCGTNRCHYSLGNLWNVS